jgi:glutamate dehydrogenase
MKILVEIGQSQPAYSDNKEQKLSEIHSLFDKQSKIKKKDLLKSLSTSLITPDSFLLSVPTDRAVSLITQFFAFIEKRDTDTSVDCVLFPEKGGTLILINAPETPYLIDSLQALQESQSLAFQIIAHHVLAVKRCGKEIINLEKPGKLGLRESFVILKIGESTKEYLGNLIATIQKTVLGALNIQRDKKSLIVQLHYLEQIPVFKPWKDFLSWLQRGAFIPFAYYCFIVNISSRKLDIQELGQEHLGLSLGSLLEQETKKADSPTLLTLLCSEEIQRESPLLVQKTGIKSPLYRSESLIYIGFKEPLEKGKSKEHAFIGLFSEAMLVGTPINDSTLLDKIERTLENLHLSPDDYEYHRLIEVFNLFPKIELFLMNEGQLQIIACSLPSFLHRSDTTKLLILPSPSPTRLTILILILQKSFDQSSLSNIEDYLCQELTATLENSQIIRGEGNHYLSLHLVLIPQQGEVHIHINRIESALTQIAQSWDHKLQVLLEEAMRKERGQALWNKYRKGFSPGYRALIPPQAALQDIKGMEKVLETGQQFIDLWDYRYGLPKKDYRLQFYDFQERFLDELMPLLDNLALRVIDQIRFDIAVENRRLFITSFSVKTAKGVTKPLSSLRTNLLAALAALFRGEVDNDPLNKLLVLTGLSWRKIDIFRSYRNYYFQLDTRMPFTLSRFHQSLNHNPQIILLLWRYFETRFRPDSHWDNPIQREEEGLLPIRLELAAALKLVTDVNEDHVLRTLFNLIDATVRTNFYRRQRQKNYFLALKISSLGIIDMPAPRPLYEIYIHSAAMEGIHMRGGYVARGGIRWSDRPDDFRTEILELMQTQMMKNALIVPVGAKGGFIVKHSSTTRKEAAEHAKRAYITFIQGLLDLTDNREGTTIVRSPEVIIYDEDDPYLVVAADKGTAHLSDTANEVARKYHFWLGDAFASGGTFGYDHKKLGITARGAWECVKRHFRELGQDIQIHPFTVIGIGSMDGDVFGNGMLLSDQIRLLAAFGPEHIFIDPDPDPEVSYRERKRLFDLPGSSWNDYDRNLISEGGGVYPRRAKDIPISPQVRHWLKIRYKFIDSDGLIRLLLSAPVNLLWLGGIGTYIKASTEKHLDVGDRANDAIRIDASLVQAQVVGEGANLGFTQKGRIEYALAGGYINKDAIDNSGGVDLSDHEVNLKILFAHLRERKIIASKEERNSWLEKVKREVCQEVLTNNYNQSLCLSLDRQRCLRDTELFMVLTDRLESAGLLDRLADAFPQRKEVLARHGEGLTRPELAVLMSYSKMQLYQALLEQPDFLSSSFLQEFIANYFPKAITDQFANHIYDHPLKKEITATALCNIIINQAGCTFITWVEELRDTAITNSVAAYLIFDKVLAGNNLRAQIYGLDNAIPTSRQYSLLLRIEDTLASFCHWILDHDKPIATDEKTLSSLYHYLRKYEQYREKNLPETERQLLSEKIIKLQEEGFTPEISRRIALLDYLVDFPLLVDLVNTSREEFSIVANTYGEVSNYLNYPEIKELLNQVPVRNHWERRARVILREQFRTHLASLTQNILAAPDRSVTTFFAARIYQQKLLKYRKMQEELSESPATDLLPFTILSRGLEALVQA